MSDSKLSAKDIEELKKLETEAILELYQIIAIAYQIQDIEYINNMISAWKTKYKKILDNPSPDFRKKIKQLLDEAYSEVVKYILSQIKLKEEKKIENQRKALKELYSILSDNYDYDTVMAEIKKWEKKYPYDSFLKMYQKRIDLAKREKNIEQYAFKQEEAFKDLYYGVVNRSGSLEELKEYLRKWEEKYSINDKFTIDHFIKHQSEIKRYTSDDFLISIAKKEENILDTITYSANTTTQDAAFKQLESIIKGKNNIDEVFKWVYKNNSIEFNDFYKQRIITAIAFEYSPKYLKTLPVPDIDLSKPALPIEQYNKINEIKRYAIISYFNLLLPQNEAISNNFFTEHIRTIYYESERRKHSNIINTFKDEVTNFIPETLKEEKGTDADLSSPTIEFSTETKNETNTDLNSNTINISAKKDTGTTLNIENNVLDIEQLIFSKEEPSGIEIVTHSETTESIIEDSTTTISNIQESTISEDQTISSSTQILEDYETETTEFIDSTITKKPYIISANVSTTENDTNKEEPIIYGTTSTYTPDISTVNSSSEELNQNVDYDTIIAFSPVFFETINNYSIQANLVQAVATKATEKSKAKKSIEKEYSGITKTRNQSE